MHYMLAFMVSLSLLLMSIPWQFHDRKDVRNSTSQCLRNDNDQVAPARSIANKLNLGFL